MSSKIPVTDFVERCSEQAKAAGVKLPAYVLLWLSQLCGGDPHNLTKVTMEIHKPAFDSTKAVFKGFPIYVYCITPPTKEDFGHFTIHLECTLEGESAIVVEWPQQSKKEEAEALPPYLYGVKPKERPTVDYSDDDDDPPPLVECDGPATSHPLIEVTNNELEAPSIWASRYHRLSNLPPVLKQSDDEEPVPPLEDTGSNVAETAEAILAALFTHSLMDHRRVMIADMLKCTTANLVNRLAECVCEPEKHGKLESRLTLALRLLEKIYKNE